jgi:hypothetical protein
VSHGEVEHGRVEMARPSSDLLNRSPRHVLNELEADINRTWRLHVFKGVTGVFESFDQHVLMLSTIVFDVIKEDTIDQKLNTIVDNISAC